MGTSTEELSSDIAQTRQSLTQDVDALQDKVSPSAIIERRKTAVRGRLSTVKDRVMGGSHDAVHGVSGTTSSAGDAIEQRVEGSPLAAGLIAFGAGLVIAGLIPASKVEAQGAQRLQEAVKEHGQPVIDEARSAARAGRRPAQGQRGRGGLGAEVQRPGVRRACQGGGPHLLDHHERRHHDGSPHLNRRARHDTGPVTAGGDRPGTHAPSWAGGREGDETAPHGPPVGHRLWARLGPESHRPDKLASGVRATGSAYLCTAWGERTCLPGSLDSAGRARRVCS